VAAPDVPGIAGQTRVVVDPAGKRTPLDPARRDAFEVSQPGFYDVRIAGQDNTPVTTVAANVDLTESDLSSVDPALVTQGVTGPGTNGAAANAGAAPPRDEVTEQSQRLWWYLLFAGMLLLIGESVVASRMSGGAA
jgi:hypothetical protein